MPQSQVSGGSGRGGSQFFGGGGGWGVVVWVWGGGGGGGAGTCSCAAGGFVGRNKLGKIVTERAG